MERRQVGVVVGEDLLQGPHGLGGVLLRRRVSGELSRGELRMHRLEVVAQGRVDEVVYVGSATRYVVRLDAGGTLVALRQNTGDASRSEHVGLNSPVRLVWDRQHVYRVADPATRSHDGGHT